LADIDDVTLDGFAEKGFDWIWLLSVWEIGSAGRAVSRSNPQWQNEFKRILPDLTDDDICGSGFAITAYRVSKTLGGPPALATFREKLAMRGIKLMLDFVPNHTALDHPWVKSHPEYYVQGDEALLARTPHNYIRIESDRGPGIFAYGRDPNYPGWPDTLQLDYTNSALQSARIEELISIARQCDGARCDMAMLQLPDVFQRTWGTTSSPFWPRATDAVRARHPGFMFMAEVYWDLEWTLQQQGFDYCYDKRLYDRLREGAVGPIRDHLSAGLDYQDKLARFLENHDEPRVAAEFGWPQHQAAAIITYFSPGLRFFHQGQSDGEMLRVPVHLCRAPVEPVNQEYKTFYGRLWRALSEAKVLRDGHWSQIAPQAAWPGNWTSSCIVAYAWSLEGERLLVVVNYSEHESQCRLFMPFLDIGDATVNLADIMGTETYVRDGADLVNNGLYIDQAPWHFNVFKLDMVSEFDRAIQRVSPQRVITESATQ
jgi:glycosidase